MQWISIVLGIAGVVASALFGVLAVVPAEPRGWVIGGAIAVGVVALLWLLIVSSPKIYEWRLRKGERKIHDLQRLRRDEEERSPSQIRDNQYGFEVIFATHGLKERDPDPNNWARIKRTRGSGSYVDHGFPLEVHKYQGTTYIVGFVSDDHKRVVEGNDTGIITLWMRPRWSARNVAEVPLTRITEEGSRGLGTWRSPSFLLLNLSRGPGSA
jgi:hypothetical protein